MSSEGAGKKSTYADGSSTDLSYDRRGNITAVTDGNGNSTSYEYDLLNRVIKTTDANNNGTHFSYDASDRISTVTDALGNVRKYTYNAGERLQALRISTERQYPLTTMIWEKSAHTRTRKDTVQSLHTTGCGT